MSELKDNKVRNLFLSLLFDALGLVSFVIPGIGEFSDIIWAPISAWLMTRLYKGKIGQAAGMVTFVEELIPGSDFIPTFTIMWFYTYVFKKKKEEVIIEA
ncbi:MULTISPECIES: hypothetical protein [Cellulophaga]|jgi:hypothetical protein|uniref:Uncharacterized protein n=2 Tax=Cellulophaga baltica TaxID=76594 RepID=A0A1G7IYQ9_9FLAO|nr:MULTISPECIES: hypothetical protein [Cellulophaga]WFO16972.1 hypothetical protein M601_004165 [Cellulophaga baltica 4]AIY14247.1 hypothetical protein M667_14175 [Cellulophaga baltica NN016038]AIZ42601.1 hypothetical protein M666_14045 [Cellulophaga baltica 18]KGK29718.1 hypothetical protein EL45_14085 [Cellulophaga sp. E6(2014)]MBA6315933.1 hypothetical protein [Cellulophaga baltica]